MAGNKNSGNRNGRPSNYQIAKQGDLLKLTTDWILDNFYTFDKKTKIRVSMEIAKRGIVQKVDMKVTHAAEELLERFNAASIANSN